MAFKCRRWTLANMLPVGFMACIILAIWTLYQWLHVLPLLHGDIGGSACGEIHGPSEACLSAAFNRGFIEACVQQTLTTLLVICFARAIFTDPGSVPNDIAWLPGAPSSKAGPEEVGLTPESEGDRTKDYPKLHESKHTGGRRFCKWCNRFKPDRSHHCRVCRSCILRMDHHCPWIANCVGFQNHKYFFLLVLYSLLDTSFVIVTVSESLYRSLIQEMQSSHRFLIVLCMTLSAIMSVLLIFFFTFHSWLMMKATTTIEFCEKTYRHSGCSHRGSTKSIYDLGCLANLRAVLGPRMLLWFLPVDPPEGDGVSFAVQEDLSMHGDEETAPLIPRSAKQSVGHVENYRSHDSNINMETSGAGPDLLIKHAECKAAPVAKAYAVPAATLDAETYPPPEVTGADQANS